MATSLKWWGKESHRGTPVVVKMENPKWSMLELEGPSDEDFIIGNDNDNNNNNRDNKEIGRAHV